MNGKLDRHQIELIMNLCESFINDSNIEEIEGIVIDEKKREEVASLYNRLAVMGTADIQKEVERKFEGLTEKQTLLQELVAETLRQVNSMDVISGTDIFWESLDCVELYILSGAEPKTIKDMVFPEVFIITMENVNGSTVIEIMEHYVTVDDYYEFLNSGIKEEVEDYFNE